MEEVDLNNRRKAILSRKDFPRLFEILSQKGYHIIGPTVSDKAIVLDEISSGEELPAGFEDIQDGGNYRLEKTAGPALFGYNVGPQGWKKFLYPSVQKLWQSQKTRSGFKIKLTDEEYSKKAFLGVRACDLAAIQIHDRIFTAGEYLDTAYRKRREKSLIIAVNCTRAGKTCFCESMGTGPKAGDGFDLALTEVIDEGRHFFIIEPGSAIGSKLLEALKAKDADAGDIEKADMAVEQAIGKMGRKIETNGSKDLLGKNFDNPHWQTIAKRCLSCGNCTMVCPTCFCTTMEDTTDLTGDTAYRVRKWDSCFTLDFSYIAGGSIRESVMSRYRQWFTHKLSAWVDQFGRFGCVGCGRCITWCPVGIDITEEARLLRESDLSENASISNKDIKDGNA